MFFVAGPESTFKKTIKALLDDVIGRAEGQLGGIRTLHDLNLRTARLREEIETLKIEKRRREEEFSRKEREVEHKVGLERKRQEFELESGKREATLKVREENLAADRERFEGQMTFHEERFSQEVGYLKDLLTEIMKRLPSAEISITQDRKSGVRRG